MKFIIIGLGVFGTSLAEKLTETGHEVIGVDKDMNKVEMLKEKITQTISLDIQDPHTATYLPLKDTDIVVVCIGEDEGANIMATALMKKMHVKRLVSRAITPLHQTVLEAMGVEEIIQPEAETAERWTKKLTMKGIVDSFVLSSEYGIIEAEVPEEFHNKPLLEIDLTKKYGILVLTIIKKRNKKNFLGKDISRMIIQGLATPETVIEDGDIVVMFGKMHNIKKLIGQ